MKHKNPKKVLLILVIFIMFLSVQMALNTEAYPDAAELGCHPLGDYTITIDEENMEIQAEMSSTITVEVIATGPDVVIDVYPDALDNELFTILSSTVIEDNSENDLDPSTDSIRIFLNITVPSESGVFTLRILSRAPTLSGGSTPLDVADIIVTTGEVIKTPFEIFFDHNNLYLGGTSLIFAYIGSILLLIGIIRKKESNHQGIFNTVAFALTTVNVFLILNEAMDFTFNSNVFADIFNFGQLNHIIMGMIGYIAGIIVVFGSFTKVKGTKMKFAVIIMLATWTLNFFHGIFSLSPNLGLGG